jgi:hypothetical protein
MLYLAEDFEDVKRSLLDAQHEEALEKLSEYMNACMWKCEWLRKSLLHWHEVWPPKVWYKTTHIENKYMTRIKNASTRCDILYVCMS